jgi:hypothetical protein
MIQVGDCVTFDKLPDWVENLSEESKRVFLFCFGRTYRVKEIDEDEVLILLVLDVSADIDHCFGGFMNDIRLESEFITRVDCE